MEWAVRGQEVAGRDLVPWAGTAWAGISRTS
jgi:hypothetical protein